jgi:stearoyl-CoA desaturase (Delta-9 desaturase)
MTELAVASTATASAIASATVHVMPAAQFVHKQRRHFLLGVAAPTLATLLLPWVAPMFGQPALAFALWALMWFIVGGIGVSVGFHRHFSHRSFDARPSLRWLLGVCGSMAAQGPVIYWVSLHRMHHAASDRPGDPHSPQPQAWGGAGGARGRVLGRVGAAWQGHLGWVLGHDVPKPTRYARELIADPLARRLSQHYAACVWAGIALPALLAWWLLGGWQGALFGAYWGGVVRIALGHHIIWAINSWCHLGAVRQHDTADTSANVAWLSLLSWGESWHNNHHARPTVARFGEGWRQPDIGWWVVRLFERLGWARVVRR